MTNAKAQFEAFEEYRRNKRIAEKTPPTSKEHHAALKAAKAALKRYKELGGDL